MELLTTSQVAALLRLSVERVRQLAKSGALPPDEITGNGRLWRLETVERFAATRGRFGRFESLTQDVALGSEDL